VGRGKKAAKSVSLRLAWCNLIRRVKFRPRIQKVGGGKRGEACLERKKKDFYPVGPRRGDCLEDCGEKGNG